MDRQVDRQTTLREREGGMDRKVGRHTERDGQTGRQRDRQRDGQTGRQTERD